MATWAHLQFAAWKFESWTADQRTSPPLSSQNWTELKHLFSRVQLCDPKDCSPPGSSVHGILQARMLEWSAAAFSRGPSWPRDQTQVSRIAGRVFTVWATREALSSHNPHSYVRKVMAGKQESKGAGCPGVPQTTLWVRNFDLAWKSLFGGIRETRHFSLHLALLFNIDLKKNKPSSHG